MSVTVNTFPPVHAFNSSRAWTLAVIVLIHAGFFWVLSSGLARSIVAVVLPRTDVVVIEPAKKTPPPPHEVAEPVIERAYVPPIFNPDFTPPAPDSSALQQVTQDPNPLPPPVTTMPVRPAPMEIAPQIDARRGLSEPVYPPAMIRQGAVGTVVLAVQVLENGRVGDVRVEQSSGYAQLDQAALREAKRWRLIPGTRDGVPVALWKQIPITFRLQE